MGEAKRRDQPIGKCIYCGSEDELTKEHVIPFAIGGKLILREASCIPCAAITGSLEQRLLRGHWWAYRIVLRLPSRRNVEQPKDFAATLVRESGEELAVRIAAEDYPFVAVFKFDPPSILEGIARDGPCVARLTVKSISATPKQVLSENGTVNVAPKDKLSIDLNMIANDHARFLAKIALGYAVRQRGLHAFEEIYIQDLILGSGDGAMTHVGGFDEEAITLPKHGIHGIREHRRGNILSVLIQLFLQGGNPLPIYEVVVGRIR